MFPLLRHIKLTVDREPLNLSVASLEYTILIRTRELGGYSPGLIVFDTFAHSARYDGEGLEALGAATAALRAACRELECAALVLRHSRPGPERDLETESFLSLVDNVVALHSDRDDLLLIEPRRFGALRIMRSEVCEARVAATSSAEDRMIIHAKLQIEDNPQHDATDP